jgi:hypothetical protein
MAREWTGQVELYGLPEKGDGWEWISPGGEGDELPVGPGLGALFEVLPDPLFLETPGTEPRLVRYEPGRQALLGQGIGRWARPGTVRLGQEAVKHAFNRFLAHRIAGAPRTIFLFSNKVVEIPFARLLSGRVQTTYGTDFDCIADSILERAFDKAVILTDGYAELAAERQAQLKKQKLQALTILFGDKTDCDEFAPFGDVVQLEDITD